MTKEVDPIREMEKQIVKCCINELLGHGFCLSIYDGGDMPIKKSTDADSIFNCMFATDEEVMIVHRPGAERREGWIMFIYGNDGYDVIADYTTSLDPYTKETDVLATRLSGDEA